jgi:ABC-type phosphate/phosphonate transport system substrate-binding protein
VLNIGTTGGGVATPGDPDARGREDTLRDFIKAQTGMNNTFKLVKGWRELASELSKNELQVGVFHGFEFAWAQAKYPDLKPLALAVNVYRYPTAFVVSNRDNSAKDFAGLAGQSFSIPAPSQPFLTLFVDRLCEANGKKAKEFFSKITTPPNVEEAVDDVVDGVLKGTVVDRAGLESYKRRKPARFAKLKPLARSIPFPSAVIAVYNTNVPEATRERFRTALINANKKEKGKTMLTLAHLTGFEAIPDDFDKELAKVRKAYPPTPADATKSR